jgi:hypothetical protein
VDVVTVQCRNCRHLVEGDPDGRMPPWCPCCGADLKPGATADEPSDEAAAAANTEAGEDSPGELDEPPSALPADESETDYESGYPGTTPRLVLAESRKNQRTRQSLATRLGMIGGMALGLVGSVTIAPQVFPQPPGGFSIEQMILAGVIAMGGAVLGWLVGRAIDGVRG